MGMRAIPVVMRERILQLYGQGKSTREIAEFFGFLRGGGAAGAAAIQGTRGTLEPQTHLCGRKTLLTSRGKHGCKSWWPSSPTPRWPSWARVWTVRFGTSTVDVWLRRLGLSYKKNAARRRAKPARRGRKKGPLA